MSRYGIAAPNIGTTPRNLPSTLVTLLTNLLCTGPGRDPLSAHHQGADMASMTSASKTSCAKKPSVRILIALATGLSLASISASAHVSVGIGLGYAAPVYAAPPVYYAPPPPPPVYYSPPPPPVVVYQTAPAPVVYGEDWRQREWHEHEWRERREWRERQEYERRRAYYGY